MTQKAVRALGPQPGKQASFLASSADLVIYGGSAGSGKTWGLLLEPLRHIGNKDFTAVFFRRTFPQITNPGAMWDESVKLYPLVGGVGRKSMLTWTFPSGARVEFAHLQYEETKLNWQGSQIVLLCWDELTHYTESQFFYLLSRNRSVSGIRPYVRATTNPDADSWVAKFIEWWIDPETGYAIPERSGVVRWFARLKGEIIWGDSPAEVEERAGAGAIAKSCTFISAHVHDNQILMRLDPGYLANLMALPLVERERLLGGNWKIRAEAGKVFNRAWFGAMLPAAPVCEKYVRYWDKASAVDGDFTVGVLMGVKEGTYYVIDVQRDRLSTFARESLIKQTAQLDKQAYLARVTTWIEQEPGSGGKDSAVSTVRNLAGFVIRVERPSADKVTRAEPMSAQAEVGNVKLVAGDWNEAFLSELHSFPTGLNDDQCLVAGTMITTAVGDVPIEKIQPGDYVLTRKGYRRVLAAGMTNLAADVISAHFSNGETLIGTTNHPIWTQAQGFIPLGDSNGQEAFSLCRHPRRLYSMALHSGATRTQRLWRIGITTALTPVTSGPELGIFTRKFGKRRTGLSRMATRYTTRTAIRSITIWTIWNASPLQNISDDTLRWAHGQTAQRSRRTWTEFDRSQKNGIVLPKDWPGTLNMVKGSGKPENPKPIRVCSAARNLNRWAGATSMARALSFVPPFAQIVSELPLDGDSRRRSVPSAVARISAATGQRLAPVSVVRVQDGTRRRAVYNLTVEGEPEYFANGILVHNCDASSGAFNRLALGRVAQVSGAIEAEETGPDVDPNW